jgi:hypothetical protein
MLPLAFCAVTAPPENGIAGIEYADGHTVIAIGLKLFPQSSSKHTFIEIKKEPHFNPSVFVR